ncbi:MULTISPECIES: DedA family protein [Brevibacillus]|jgi:membrane-associated protein|uniref:VTT domain-containing protein n=1 Tax=Brevibacillus parabrevis TaxID=54914 RepID=A0A4Y3PU89_BREPA|nr:MULTISPECIES: DedA family protein [Brevibacillus]MBU8715992.1 DedA family protein [Brevibacillus parabrevis]MDR5002657.1 DedA family protein [Brevibacillus parabrevis]MED2256968.1 DedA family protein [Brevibacillus parabrevis]NRQ56552.1 DedA family protein [Brevibacillus sp. HD1.4A]RNB93282.1 DedA family protein [Brevibacillus parabrevis]
MIVDMLTESVGQFGYFALFFMLWLGIVGMPIPDEVIVLSAGVLTSLGILHVFPAFVATYLGVVSGLSLGYVLGRWLGAPALNWIGKKKGMNKYVDRAQALLDRYGSYALCISYFLPVVRHVVPYLVGIGKMTFRRYALFSYTTGLVWTLVLFFAGNLMGNNVENLNAFVGMFNQTMVVTAVGLVILAAISYYGYTLWKRQKSEASSARSLTVEREGNE